MEREPDHLPIEDGAIDRVEQPVEPRERRFPCAKCGARLEYAPGTVHLRCQYCGHENEIPQTGEEIQELDFLTTIEEAQSHEPSVEVTTVKCGACAAEVRPPPHITSFTCPFCATNIVAQPHSDTIIRPRALLPFAIDRRKSTEMFLAWLGKRWFAPSDLKRFARTEGRFQGIYVPYWTYDCRTTTAYSGARGEHYYVTVGSGQNQRRERRTRWYPASGTVSNSFDDLLVLLALRVV
jgi:DNA-directed RNA polymerase subunit RPC12/RpoP